MSVSMKVLWPSAETYSRQSLSNQSKKKQEWEKNRCGTPFPSPIKLPIACPCFHSHFHWFGEMIMWPVWSNLLVMVACVTWAISHTSVIQYQHNPICRFGSIICFHIFCFELHVIHTTLPANIDFIDVAPPFVDLPWKIDLFSYFHLKFQHVSTKKGVAVTRTTSTCSIMQQLFDPARRSWQIIWPTL